MGSPKRLGILVGGGPAPGINAVISAATIEALNQGFEVIGIRDGFKHLVRRDPSALRPLTIDDVSRVLNDVRSVGNAVKIWDVSGTTPALIDSLVVADAFTLGSFLRLAPSRFSALSSSL